jgi:NTE family protein
MRIGLALGGGGAKGLAHIPILEVLDELGVRPSAIAGTSIGAVIGAFYASGVPARQIRDEFHQLIFPEDEADAGGFELPRGIRQLLDLIDIDVKSGGLLRGEKFLDRLYEDVRARTFEELQIPLKVVATEFWTREQRVVETGELIPAVRASMSLPVLFSPVVHGTAVLMDGGAVNPVPYDLLFDDCDFTIAVDVAGQRTPGPNDQIPSLTESIFNTFQIMSKAIVDQKLRVRAPDVYLRPEIVDVQVLDFDRAEEIYAGAESACQELRERLAALPASQVAEESAC